MLGGTAGGARLFCWGQLCIAWQEGKHCVCNIGSWCMYSSRSRAGGVVHYPDGQQIRVVISPTVLLLAAGDLCSAITVVLKVFWSLETPNARKMLKTQARVQFKNTNESC